MEDAALTAPDLDYSVDGKLVPLRAIFALLKEDQRRWDGHFPLNVHWSASKTLRLEFSTSARLYQGVNNAMAIKRGPLVFALPIEPEWKKVKDNPRFADWEVYPKSPWNYALPIDRKQVEQSITFRPPVRGKPASKETIARKRPAQSIVFEDRPVGPMPFSPRGAPVIAKVKGRRLPSWGLEQGAAAPPPSSPVKSSEPLEALTLIPYGCTDLRITEFPTLTSP